MGGIGIPNLQHSNMCLLASWISGYHLNDNVLWRKIVDFKYITNEPNLFCCREIGSSSFWKGVLWACKAAQMGYSWRIGNGQQIRFWEDSWFGNTSLAIQYWPLYVIVNEKGRQLLVLSILPRTWESGMVSTLLISVLGRLEFRHSGGRWTV